jgi:hypothetical protein
VSALDGAAVIPGDGEPLASARFSVESFAAARLAVNTIEAPVPPMVNRFDISVTLASAVLTFAAHSVGVSPEAIATVVAIGDPITFAAVSVAITLLLEDAVPAAVAVSTWAVPLTVLAPRIAVASV